MQFMPSVFIHEIVNDRLLVRFMGTELVDRWRHDATGQEFGARLPPEERARLAKVSSILTSHPCGLLQRGVLGTSTGRDAAFEGILLPLAVNHDAPPRIVVFSTILDSLGREEHGSALASAGQRWWIDIGAGVPALPPPAQPRP